MTRSVRIREEAAAVERFTYYSQRLNLELAMNTPRRHIDPLLELLDLYVERTGGSVLTEQLRVQLAEFKQRVAAREHAERRAQIRVLS